MALNAYTVGGTSPDYATIAAWETARDGVGTSGDDERALLRAGTFTEDVVISGWATGVTVSIYPDTGAEHDGTPGSGALITSSGSSYALYLDNTSVITVVIRGIEIQMTGSGSAVGINRKGTYTFQKCLIDDGTDNVFINGPQCTGAVVNIEACALYNASGQTINVVSFINLGDHITVNVRNCVLDDAVVRMRTAAGSYFVYFNCYNTILYGARESGTGSNVDWGFTDCLFDADSGYVGGVAAASPSVNVTFSATIVTGTPASGQIGVVSITTPDYHLVDHANNLAIDYGDGANAPSFGEDFEGDACATTGTDNINAGCDQFVVAGGVTVTPSAASLTLATFAPTVSVPVTVTPSTASLTLATFAPTVSVPVTVTPSTASLTLATFAPTVSADGSVLVTPSTASLTLATFAPTVSADGSVLVTPSTASLTLATFAPTVSVPVTVTPSTASLTLATFAPTVSAGTNVLARPSTASLTLATFAPAVAFGAASVYAGDWSAPAAMQAGDQWFVELSGPSIASPGVIVVVRFTK